MIQERYVNILKLMGTKLQMCTIFQPISGAFFHLFYDTKGKIFNNGQSLINFEHEANIRVAFLHVLIKYRLSTANVINKEWYYIKLIRYSEERPTIATRQSY